MAVKFIALSGTTGVTENLYVYETERDMILVDCGVGFPDSDMLGVDLVIPDFGYIKKRRDKLRGILLTHGHEDHIGALPFLLRDVDTKVYGTALTIGFVEDKLRDYEMEDKLSLLNVFSPEQDKILLGEFSIDSFRVSHSVPDAVGFVIETSEGKLFHVADFKFDWTSVDKRPFDVAKAALLAGDGVLGLACDGLGSTTPGYTESEAMIEDRIEQIVNDSKGQVFFTTISSNISRMQQAINVAQRHGRSVVFVGRSTESKAEIARRIGYLKYKKGLVVPLKTAVSMASSEVLYVVSGSYGQPGSSLYKVAMGTHDTLKIEENDTVIFSGDPAPPGSKTNVDFLVDRLFELGVRVHYYDMQEDLHVSGHGSQQDIRMLIGITKPRYLIPIGGTMRHMKAFEELAVKMGYSSENVYSLLQGESVEFANGLSKKGKRVKTGNVLVDGLGVGDVGNVVLRDRKILAKEGVVIALVQASKERGIESIELISRGFVFEKEHKGFLNEVSVSLGEVLRSKNLRHQQAIKAEAVNYLERFLYKETGRRPMVLPLVVEI